MNRPENAPLQDMKEDIHNLIDSQNFNSLEELQAVLDQYYQQRNYAPVDNFHGLSPEQMHHFLHMPFDTPELFSFPSELKTEPESKAAFILKMLIEGIGEDGMKLTAKGNLGQKFCQEASKRYFEKYPERMMSRLSVRTETNFEPLHTIRLTAGLCGLTRKYKGKLLLTKKCQTAMDKGGMKTLYPLLLRSYIQKFNWAYRDGYQELFLIQQSFLFSLYLLQKYGNSRQSSTFYADNFLEAFPMLINEVEPKLYESPEDTIKQCYTLRTLQRFADFFGLADVEQISNEPLNHKYRVRALELLDKIVKWHV